MTERELQIEVIKRARWKGWRVAAFPKIQDVHGTWRTPVAADGKGFLDLLMVRDRTVVMELKTDRGELSTEQQTWLTAWRIAGVEAYVIRPGHLDDGLVDGILDIRNLAPINEVRARALAMLDEPA